MNKNIPHNSDAGESTGGSLNERRKVFSKLIEQWQSSGLSKAAFCQLPQCVAEALGSYPTAVAQLIGRQRRPSLFHGSDHPVAQRGRRRRWLLR
jgi:hypothetical protein